MASKYTVKIPKNVRDEIDEIIAFYYADREEYALRILDDFFTRIESLKNFPEKGRIVPELQKNNITEYREVIESFWRIIYRIENKTVVIYTLIDSRRNVEEILLRRMREKFT